jgi:AcrR family transcriptional regulator
MSQPLPKPRGRKPTKMDPGKLLEAAQEVFAETGVAGASIRAIANRAGCDPALIYYHFGSKEAVFEALLDGFFIEFIEALTVLTKSSADDHCSFRLWKLTIFYADRLTQNGQGLRCLLRGEAVLGADGIRTSLARRIKPMIQVVGQVFREGVDRGELRQDLALQIVPFLFIRPLVDLLDLIPAMSEHIVGEPSNIALPHVLHAWFGIFWRGVAADPGKPISFKMGV